MVSSSPSLLSQNEEMLFGRDTGSGASLRDCHCMSTINCLLMCGGSICSSNLYSSSHSQLKAEPGGLSSTPESFCCQDPARQGLQTPADDLTPHTPGHPKEPGCRALRESLLSTSHCSAHPIAQHSHPAQGWYQPRHSEMLPGTSNAAEKEAEEAITLKGEDSPKFNQASPLSLQEQGGDRQMLHLLQQDVYQCVSQLNSN